MYKLAHPALLAWRSFSSDCDLPVTSDHKHSPVAFRITVALVAVLVKGLRWSFGPACWIASRSGNAVSVVNSAYQPILRLAFDGPGLIQRGMGGHLV